MDHKGIHEDTQQHKKRTQLMLRTPKAGRKEFKSLDVTQKDITVPKF